MQKNVSPVVAIIVIAALIAVIAFLWVRFTGPPPLQAGPGSVRSAGAGGRPTGGRERPTRERGHRRGERGGAERGAAPGGGEAEPSPE